MTNLRKFDRVMGWVAGFAILGGAVGFGVGLLGPKIFMPNEDQWPILAYVYVGPYGALIGALVGLAVGLGRERRLK